MFKYAERLKKLREKMQAQSINALVIGGADRFDANAYYYSGDSAFPCVLLLTPTSAELFTTLQAQDVPAAKVFSSIYPFKAWKKAVEARLNELKPKKVAFDRRSDTSGFFAFQKTAYEKIDFTPQLLQMREKKDPDEIKLLREAQELTKKIVHDVVASGVDGLTESQIAGRIEFRAREAGSSLDAFTPLIQSGANTAVFHASTTNKKVDTRKEVLLIDAGCRVDFYCADHTLTVYNGKDEDIISALNAVKESQAKSQALAKAGASGKQVVEKALDVLAEFGYRNKFTFHGVGLGLGHSVGLEVHDGWRRIDEVDKLEKGMAFTVEPGLYFPRKFGIRFEEVAFI